MSGPRPKKEAAKALLKSAWSSTKSLATGKSKIVLLTEEATNDEKWGPTGQQMAEISDACFDAEKFRQVWTAIMKRFESEPSDWRRIYKALLLTEHLLKNSSQHVVQTILENVGVLEGLKQFKYLDEKMKDHGINVSNRAKELTLLLENSDRIRAERAKAKALREKFKGASREDMAAAAAANGGFGVGTRGPQYGGYEGVSPSGAPFDDMGAGGSLGSRQQLGGGSEGSTSGSPRPHGRHALPADDGGHLGGDEEGMQEEQRPATSSRSSAKGYNAVSAADPVAATAQRIDSLRQAGMLNHSDTSGGSTPTMHTSASYDDLSLARSGGSQTKPSLQELMARKSTGPKKLQEVRVNPAIAAALGAIKPPAPASPTKPTAVALPPPPGSASPQRNVPSSAKSPGPDAAFGAFDNAPTSSAPLPDLLTVPPPAAPAGSAVPVPVPASHSPVAASSGASSPWSGSPSMATSGDQPGAMFNAFSAAAPFTGSPTTTSGGSFGSPDSFGTFVKPGAGPAGTINLTATAVHAGSGSPGALPAHLFAEPVLPSYGTAASWGTHVGGAAPKQSPVAGKPLVGGTAPKPAVKQPAEELFADFSPFK